MMEFLFGTRGKPQVEPLYNDKEELFRGRQCLSANPALLISTCLALEESLVVSEPESPLL